MDGMGISVIEGGTTIRQKLDFWPWHMWPAIDIVSSKKRPDWQEIVLPGLLDIVQIRQCCPTYTPWN